MFIGVVGVFTLYDKPYVLVLALGLLLGGVVILSTMIICALTPCPRCSTRLRLAGAFALWKKPTNNCSTCGVHFDEPMSDLSR
jgi:hypothetical protein